MPGVKTILFVFLFFPGILRAGPSDPLGPHFALIPAPQRIEAISGPGLLYSQLLTVEVENTDQIRLLSDYPASLPVHISKRQQDAPGMLSLQIDTTLDLPSPEGYVLRVANKRVDIRAKGRAGLFYALQTLNQLLEDARDQDITIPACLITDYPSIAVRAVHLDLKHHLDAGFYYYHIIDVLASIKVNTVFFEFEDKLRYRKAPAVAAPQAISIEEFAALSKYAHDRYIEINPLVQGLGHASFILKHEQYKELRDDPASDWAFDPMNPKTYALQFALYEDAIAATPYGKYLHIGGDEVGTLGRSAQTKNSGRSAIELQMYWLKKVTDFAQTHHRTPIFWDDMVFKLSGLYKTTYDTTMNKDTVVALWKKNSPKLDANSSLFPANCIYMRWNYESPNALGDQLAIDWYKAHHLDVMPATSAQQSYAVLQRNHSNFPYIRDFCLIAKAKQLDKILCTVWDDSSPHFETVWRGLYDFAWFSWNAADTSEQNVHAAFRHRFFAPALAAQEYECRDLLESAITFWETAFLEEGDRESYYPSYKLMELPTTGDKGKWSRRYQQKLHDAAASMDIYRLIKDRIQRCMTLSRRNRYALEILDQINELQGYSANLLLLIKKYDESNTAEALIQIREWVNGFTAMRTKLEQVFGRTRMMGNPDGYIRDTNLHLHLANGTNNTDWMYYYELPMNRKIGEWLRSR
ncbi:MAG: beta-N-acetylhexosaminidase [Chitinophagaceae bacterium]|nr:beta-N-acetylhexosaminidase [Chitinophagaceae bacterium]